MHQLPQGREPYLAARAEITDVGRIETELCKGATALSFAWTLAGNADKELLWIAVFGNTHHYPIFAIKRVVAAHSVGI